MVFIKEMKEKNKHQCKRFQTKNNLAVGKGEHLPVVAVVATVVVAEVFVL